MCITSITTVAIVNMRIIFDYILIENFLPSASLSESVCFQLHIMGILLGGLYTLFRYLNINSTETGSYHNDII